MIAGKRLVAILVLGVVFAAKEEVYNSGIAKVRSYRDPNAVGTRESLNIQNLGDMSLFQIDKNVVLSIRTTGKVPGKSGPFGFLNIAPRNRGFSLILKPVSGSGKGSSFKLTANFGERQSFGAVPEGTCVVIFDTAEGGMSHNRFADEFKRHILAKQSDVLTMKQLKLMLSDRDVFNLLNKYRVTICHLGNSKKLDLKEKDISALNSKTGSGIQAERTTATKNAFARLTTCKPSDFELVDELGEGQFGKVYMARKVSSINPNDYDYYAVKVMNKNETRRQQKVDETNSEVEIMKRIASGNTGKGSKRYVSIIHCAFQDRRNVFIALEYLSGPNLEWGELLNLINGFETWQEREDFVRPLMAQIVQGLLYLHSLNVMHGDIKANNFMLDKNGDLKIFDFGLSKVIDSISTHEPRYNQELQRVDVLYPPEVVLGQEYDYRADWYMVGSLLLTILYDKGYFQTMSLKLEDYKKILSTTEIPPNVKEAKKFKHQRMSAEVLDLIEKLSFFDRNKRLMDGEKLKKHPWFKGIDWNRYGGTIPRPFRYQDEEDDGRPTLWKEKPNVNSQYNDFPGESLMQKSEEDQVDEVEALGGPSDFSAFGQVIETG